MWSSINMELCPSAQISQSLPLLHMYIVHCTLHTDKSRIAYSFRICVSVSQLPFFYLSFSFLLSPSLSNSKVCAYGSIHSFIQIKCFCVPVAITYSSRATELIRIQNVFIKLSLYFILCDSFYYAVMSVHTLWMPLKNASNSREARSKYPAAAA